jgi:hypothetical protein
MSENDQELWDALRGIQDLLETVMRQDPVCVDDWDTISRFIGRRQIDLSDKIDHRRDVLTVSLTRSPQT